MMMMNPKMMKLMTGKNFNQFDRDFSLNKFLNSRFSRLNSEKNGIKENGASKEEKTEETKEKVAETA